MNKRESINELIEEIYKNKQDKTDLEILFVFPILKQITLCVEDVKLLTKHNQISSLGCICRQIMELYVTLFYVLNKKFTDEEWESFVKFFIKNQRLGRLSKGEKGWKNLRPECLLQFHEEKTNYSGLKDAYDALCKMTHFSSIRVDAFLRDKRVFSNTYNSREEKETICKLANTFNDNIQQKTLLIVQTAYTEYLGDTRGAI